jgi:hypothetical protein
MSLDKFVARGYSGSLGDTTGQWVSRTAETPRAQPTESSRETGTSFVMGGSRVSTAGYRAKNSQNLDSARSQNADDIMHRGTKHYREARNSNDLRQNCFGGSSRPGDTSASDTSMGFPIERMFRLIMILLGVVGVLYLVFSWPQSSRDRVRALREQQVLYGDSE